MLNSKYLSVLVFSLFSVLSSSAEFEFLYPGEVEGLSADISEILINEECKIPKWIFEFGGVTFGEFAEAGQKDTAVICIKAGASTIRVFWGGPKTCPSSIDSFGQYIDTVNEKYIIEHYQAYGGIEPPKITHEAINDHFVEKASVVKYCHNGVWLDLTGAD